MWRVEGSVENCDRGAGGGRVGGGLGVEGEGEGGGDDEGSAEPGGGAEGFAEEEDAEEGADEGLDVEEDAGLGGGDLGESPVPEEGGGSGAEDATGREG